MAKFTDRDEIEVALRYIRRVRAMQPTEAALRDLDHQEMELKRRLRALEDGGARGANDISLSSTTRIADSRRRTGFGV